MQGYCPRDRGDSGSCHGPSDCRCRGRGKKAGKDAGGMEFRPDHATEMVQGRMTSPRRWPSGTSGSPVGRALHGMGAPRSGSREAPIRNAMDNRFHHRLSTGSLGLFRGARVLSATAVLSRMTTVAENAGARPSRHGSELIATVNPVRRWSEMPTTRRAPIGARSRLGDYRPPPRGGGVVASPPPPPLRPSSLRRSHWNCR